MLASAEPEAMKSTAAMIALKAIGDPSAFLELNSTTEYIDLYRDSTSLPLGEYKIRGRKRPHFWLCSTFHEFFYKLKNNKRQFGNKIFWNMQKIMKYTCSIG